MAEQQSATAVKRRRGGRKPMRFKIAIIGEPGRENVLRAQLMLLGRERREIESAAADFKSKEAEYAEEARRELEKINYRRRLPIHRVDIETAAGMWRAVVEKYHPAAQPLGHFHVRYGVVRLEPQFEGGCPCRLGLWVQRWMLTTRGHVREVAKALAAWLEDDEPEGEYICGTQSLDGYTPVWPDLPDDLLGVAGARVRLRRDPELRARAEAWLKARERETYPFTARMADEQFEAHWKRVSAMRVEQHALEAVTLSLTP